VSERSDWLNNLKVGDDVVCRGAYSEVSIAQITRITKAQVFVRVNERYEQAFWKKDGYQVGGNIWRKSTLGQPTQEIRDSIELMALRRKAFLMAKALIVPNTKDEVVKLIEALKPYMVAT